MKARKAAVPNWPPKLRIPRDAYVTFPDTAIERPTNRPFWTEIPLPPEYPGED